MPTPASPATHSVLVPASRPKQQEPPRNKYYSPEVYALADLLAIPVSAARRVFAACEVN